MSRQVLFLCLLLPLVGCGPRAEVAKDRLLDQINHLLGEVDVRRQQVEVALNRAESGVDRLTHGRIEVQVELNRMSDDLSTVEDEIAQADNALTRLRDLLDQEGEFEIAGTTYTPARLEEIAQRAVTKRKKLVAQATSLAATKDRLEKILAMIQRREREGRDRLATFEWLLVEIDAKTVALKAIQEATKIAGEADTLDFDGLEKQVRDLGAQIDAELAFHEEMWREADLDLVLRSLGDTEAVVQIDEFLKAR